MVCKNCETCEYEGCSPTIKPCNSCSMLNGDQYFLLWEPKSDCKLKNKEEKKMKDFNIQNELKCATAPDKVIPFTVSGLGEKAVERLIDVKNKIDSLERFIGSTETVPVNGECPRTPDNLIHNLQMICELADEINIRLNRIQEKL